jgi:hypothetical protein
MRYLESRSPYAGSSLLLGFLVGMSLVLLLHSCTTPAYAEDSDAFPLGATGVAKGDLTTLQLYQGDITNPVADPGIVLAEDSGWYQWTSLPDVEAGGTQYLLVWEYATTGYGGSYTWPVTTRTPQSIVNRISVQVSQNPLKIVSGATIPSASTRIKGLAADPTGSTVTFTLWTSAHVVTLSNVSATLSDIDQLADGTWEADVTHDWTIGETGALSGWYYGKFTLTLPGGGVLIAPVESSGLQVRVFP